MTDSAGVGDSNITSKGRGPYTPSNFAFMTLEEEWDGKNGTGVGWTRITMPVGPGGMPADAPTIGMRGEQDVDNDETYGVYGVAGAPYWDDAGTGPQSPPTTGGGGPSGGRPAGGR